MSSESRFQQGVAVVLGAIAVWVLVMFVPRPPFQPHGIVLPTQAAKAPADVVDVHLYQQFPLVYQKMGYISIEMHADRSKNGQSKQEVIIDKAKALVAQVGGNGLVFNLMYASSPEGAAMNMYYLRGYAIYAPVPADLDVNAFYSH